MTVAVDSAAAAFLPSPDDLTSDWNEVDAARPKNSYRVTEKNELFQGVITKAAATIQYNKDKPTESSYNMQLELTLRAMNSMGALAGPETRAWITLPSSNPKVPGHKPYASGEEYDRLHGKARNFIYGILGDQAEIPDFAEKRGDTYVDPTTGEVVDGPARKLMEAAVHAKTRSILNGWYKELLSTGTSPLIKSTVFFNTYLPTGGKYAKVGGYFYEAGDRTVVTEGFTG